MHVRSSLNKLPCPSFFSGFLRHAGFLYEPITAMDLFGWMPKVLQTDMGQGIFHLIDKNDLKGTLVPHLYTLTWSL